MTIAFDNSYARLPDRFYARLAPTPVTKPDLVRFNHALGERLGLTGLGSAEVLAGNAVPDGAEPMALAYAGHQFGQFVPQLGDGRAILLGEVGGYDVQLKGSGPTPFSRNGDGRAALGPVLREYLVSEAMAAMGIPTTRTLAAATTGETVYRETRLPGAVLTRIASSHLRVGTFQYFLARNDDEAIRILADYAIARHYPEAASAENRYRAFLEAVIERQARLVAAWLLVGFVHGVMNTDNCSISGETIDYGPCAFMEAYDTATVFSSIDYYGRYAYGNQPRIALWNLARLAECLLSLMSEEEAGAALTRFANVFEEAYHSGLRRKIGLTSERDGDDALVRELLSLMATDGADFTLTFRQLSDAADGDATVAEWFKDVAAFDAWLAKWRERLAGEPNPGALMRATNPAVIPRNHLVEHALNAATNDRDYQPFEDLLTAVNEPFRDNPKYMTPAREDERVLQTFCGT